MKRKWLLPALALLGGVLAALGGCGGGGGGGGGGFFPLPPATQPSLATTVVLSGTVSYESVPNPAGPLVYAASAFRPVRGAVVEIVEEATAAVLVSTTTDGMGTYTTSVPARTSVVVRVKAQLLQTGDGARWDVSVRDNTRAEALYAMETPAFASGSQALVRDVQAPSGWNGTSYASLRVAGPFAVLDTLYAAQAKVLAVAPTTVFPPLQVFWSIDNVPAAGDPALGQIGTTFFRYTDGRHAIYVLGRENVDTDEYDASVIAHEWGHYYQSAFSRDDSPGGGHALADQLDRRVAFSEGWGNAWSGIALGRSTYTDAVGPGQARGVSIDLAAGPTSDPGWYRENSIQSVFWNLERQVGFQPIHAALTSSAFRHGAAVTAIHPFTAAFQQVAPGSAAVLAGLLAGQNIRFVGPGDPFGMAETNDGGVAVALPMYGAAAVGSVTTACVSNQAGHGNKLGNHAYLRFTAPQARSYAIMVAGPVGTDPDFTVFQGAEIVTAEGIGTTESRAVTLLAGESVLALRDFNGTSSCFTVSIQ